MKLCTDAHAHIQATGSYQELGELAEMELKIYGILEMGILVWSELFKGEEG